MVKNGKQARRTLIAAGVIVVMALAGLLAITSDRVTADVSDTSRPGVSSRESDQSAQPDNKPSFTSAFPSLVRMISALVIVIVCIYLGLYLLKRMMGKRYTGGGRNDLLEIMGTICVAPKKSVSLIRVADKSVLVGMTDSQISVLTELDAGKTAEITAVYKDDKEKDRFSDVIKSASDRIRNIGARKS